MRNDVKLGFAIGGVLLAVLIIYVLVVPGGTQSKKVTKGTGDSTAAKTDGRQVTLEPVQGAGAATQPAVPPPVTDAAPARQTDPFAPKTTPAPEPVAQSQSPNNDLDWNKLLNDQPVLMIDTPTPAGSRSVAATPQASAATPAAPKATLAAPQAAPAAAQAAPAASPAASAAQVALGPTPTPSPAPAAGVLSNPPAPSAIADPLTAATRPAGARTHRVQQGETLSSISTAAYGNANQYPAILKANPGLDPQRLRVGQTIALPDLAALPRGDAVAQPAAGRVAPVIDATREYRVAAGDNLHKISQKLYGDIAHAEKIFELNKQAMGDDRHRLKVGQVLQLPEPPTVTASSSPTR